MTAKAKRWVVTVRVSSAFGNRPVVRTLGGDTVFISLLEGQTATWTLKTVARKAPHSKVFLPHPMSGHYGPDGVGR
jgi:hypothetical protein